MVNNIPLVTGFHTSQVVQDSFHQQYDIHTYYIEIGMTAVYLTASSSFWNICEKNKRIFRKG